MEDLSKERTLFSWLHVSDIHILQGDESNQSDQQLILFSLQNAIKQYTANTDLRIPQPDVMFVTGDIGFSGGVKREDEYIQADSWLINIAKAAGLTRKDIFVVPGNHDVQRNVYNTNDSVAMLIDLLREDKRKLDWALSRQLEHLSERFVNFSKFASNFAPRNLNEYKSDNPLFWNWKRTIPVGHSIYIIGLNTALLSQDEQDRKKLRISLNQFFSIPNVDDDTPHISISLGHHPLDWLLDSEYVESWLRKKVHIYLSGHVHEADSAYHQTGGGTELINIRAGAVHEAFDNSVASSCFNYAAIVIKENGQTVVRIWNKVWSEKHKDFRDNPDLHPTDSYFAEHPLRVSFTKNDKAMGQLSYRSNPKGFSYSERKMRNVNGLPLRVDVWVGREAELDAVNKTQAGVIVITGIGGQGKSAFASKFLEMWKIAHPNDFWDWRDCREQRERFHNQLVAIIEHITNYEVLGSSLEGAETKDLVRLFFDIASNRRGLIILDNLDHYIDLAEGKFTLGVAEFVEGALTFSHNLVIVITCRPRISYDSPRFYEVPLKGISESDTLKLFQLRGVKSEQINGHATSEAIKEIHRLADGHPLWLTLIASQVARTPNRFDQIINDLKSGQIDEQAKTKMRAIWKGLNVREQMLLRYMAELSAPERIEVIHDCTRTKDKFKSFDVFKVTFRLLQHPVEPKLNGMKSQNLYQRFLLLLFELLLFPIRLLVHNF